MLTIIATVAPRHGFSFSGTFSYRHDIIDIVLYVVMGIVIDTVMGIVIGVRVYSR